MIDDSTRRRGFAWHKALPNKALPNEVQAGCVHVWATPPDGEDPGDQSSSLSDAEAQRAKRFAFAADRRRFIRSHAFLRRVLSSYLGMQPSEIEFAHGANGKPGIPDQPGPSAVQFSLSHCERLVVVAVTSHSTVGADIETVRPIPDYMNIAKHFFAKQEYATLLALPEEERCRAFFRCWTRKEAVTKALGLGLAMPLHSFEVPLSVDSPASIMSLEPCTTTLSNWSLIYFEPLDEVVGAIAIPFERGVVEGFLLADW